MNQHSDNLNELYTALYKAQLEFPTIRVNRKAFKNEYADLYAIVKPLRIILGKYELSLYGWESVQDGHDIIGVTLAHSSGQYVKSYCRLQPDPCKNPNDQPLHKIGGAITYQYRYLVKNILGVLISDDPEDDDAQEATVEYKPYQPSEYVTSEQFDELQHILLGYDDIKKDILNGLHINSLQYLPKQMFYKVVERIKERIALKK